MSQVKGKQQMYTPLKTRHYLPQVVFSQFYC
jgi:hypothetical protein